MAQVLPKIKGLKIRPDGIDEHTIILTNGIITIHKFKIKI